MKKKDYMKPTMNVVNIKMQGHLLALSNTSTTGGVDMSYDKNGGNQEDAW